MADTTRRDVLIGGGALIGSVALGAHAFAQTVPAGQQASAYAFFTPREARFVEAAVARLIPQDPNWPGALEAGVPGYIDLQLVGPYGHGERLYLKGPVHEGVPGQGYQLGLTPAELYRVSIGTIDRELQQRSLDFAEAPGEQQDAFLQQLERGGLTIEGGFPSSIFFETLLANTIEGFFCDPAYGGNRNMASWRMIGFPGAYAAYLEVYTRHGIHYTREPISMAASAHSHSHGPGQGHATPGR